MFTEEIYPPSHHPWLYLVQDRSGASCACGWTSAFTYTTILGAELAFSAHLLEVEMANA